MAFITSLVQLYYMPRIRNLANNYKTFTNDLDAILSTGKSTMIMLPVIAKLNESLLHTGTLTGNDGHEHHRRTRTLSHDRVIDQNNACRPPN